MKRSRNTGICISGPAWIVRNRIAIPAAQRNPQMFMITRERVEPDHVDGAAADLHPGEQGDRRQERGGDRPAQERRKAVAEHDPDPVRRREQEPAGEASLEVARDAEAGEDAAERRRLEQHEDELERRVAVGG